MQGYLAHKKQPPHRTQEDATALEVQQSVEPPKEKAAVVESDNMRRLRTERMARR
jgi:hypothetical protein